jgi:hypothetical protein
MTTSPASLKQISPKKLIQSLPATTATTGVVKIATGTELSDPFDSSHYTELALSPKGAINCPLFAKAWATISTSLAHDAISGNTSLDASFNIGTELTSGTLTSSKKYKIIEYKSGDDFTNIGGTNVTGNQFIASGTTPTTWTNSSRLVLVPTIASEGVMNFTFSDALPSANYMVMVTSTHGTGTTAISMASYAVVSSAVVGSFTLSFYEINDSAVSGNLKTPRSVQFLVFGT